MTLINDEYYKPLIDFCREAERQIRENGAKPTWDEAYKGFPVELAADLEAQMKKLYPNGENFCVYLEDGTLLIEN